MVSTSEEKCKTDILCGNQFHIENPGFNSFLTAFPSIDFETDIKISVEDFEYAYDFEDNMKLLFKNEKSSFNSISLAKFENLTCLKFSSELNIGIGEIMKRYNDFLNLFTLLMGTREQFSKFSFRKLNSKDWLQIHYFDELAEKTKYGLFTIDITKNKDEFHFIISKWFENQELRNCCEYFLDNILGLNISHNSRFSNSFSTLESFIRNFVNDKMNVEKFFKSEKKLLTQMTGAQSEEEIYRIIKNLIVLRNKIVHKNQTPNIKHSEIEVLYDSMLLDYLLLYKIYKFLGVNEYDLNRLILSAAENYTHVKNLNKFLYSDYFKK